MFTNVKRWVDIYNKDQETVEFKGVPQKEVKVVTTEVKLTGLDEDIKIDSIPSIKTEIKPVSEMKWGEFKTYCKEQGLSVKGKKRAELEEELKAL